MRSLGLLLLTGTSLTLSAQLAPQQDAPLSAHLLEVNAQWAVRDVLPSDAITATHFRDEAARIATHLRLVREHLLAHTPEGLSAEQLDARLELLDDLGSYAERGSFPQNHVLPYRNPVFIDPDHTACAVGQLMIESGNSALAERISAELNLGYVAEILSDERFRMPVADWANAHGFTADELAWIQPGYPPQTFWGDMGGGTDSTVQALLNDGMGNLYVAGLFTSAGGTAATAIARWDGSQYHAVGAGLDGQVHALEQFDGKLYAGGQFQNGLYDLAIWENNTWTYANVMLGNWALINDLHVFNGQLHAAGEASGFPGVVHSVMVLQGGTWNLVDQSFNGSILTLGEHDGDLVAGGDFTELGQFGGTPCAHVARLVNGSWEQLSNGLPDRVNALHDRNGTLLAGGLIFDGMNAGFGLALIAPSDTAWSLPAFSNGSLLGTGSMGVSAVTGFGEHNGEVYLCGNFNVFGPWWNSDGSQAALWIDATEDVAGIAWINGPGVAAVTSYNGQVVIGGEFQSANMTLCSNVASSDLIQGMLDRDAEPLRVKLSPVPVADVLTVRFTERPEEGTRLTVVDASGRTVMDPVAARDVQLTLDVGTLPAGSYWLQTTEAGRVQASGFVKH